MKNSSTEFLQIMLDVPVLNYMMPDADGRLDEVRDNNQVVITYKFALVDHRSKRHFERPFEKLATF